MIGLIGKQLPNLTPATVWRTKMPRKSANCICKSAMGSDSGAIVWFRRDLRLSDNEALTSAAENNILAPFYCLQPEQLAATAQPVELPVVLPVLGPYRAK